MELENLTKHYKKLIDLNYDFIYECSEKYKTNNDYIDGERLLKDLYNINKQLTILYKQSIKNKIGIL